MGNKLSIALAMFSIFTMVLTPIYSSQYVFADKPDVPKSQQKIPVDEKITKQFFKKDGKILERTTHIFYLKDKDSNAKGNNGNNAKGGDPTEGCYSFLAKGMKWKSTEPYLVNPTFSGLDDTFVQTTIDAGVQEWDSQVSFNIFGTGSLDNSAQVVTSTTDDKNVIVFGTVTDNNGNPLTNVIAVTYTWAYWNAPTPFREILEWDIIFNKGVFNFGDATGNNAMMDLGGIGTHELGHASGMGHTSSGSTCQDQTMYPSAAFGETKKRSLESGDIAGIKKLY